jgi:hypothetical protein
VHLPEKISSSVDPCNGRLRWRIVTATAMAEKKSRARLYARFLALAALVITCAWYSRLLERQWTAFFPRACADVPANPPSIDAESFPARIGPQENLCERVGDGHCARTRDDDEVRGECRGGRMDGRFTVKDAKSGAIRWSGEYADGWPRGEVKILASADHHDVYHIESLHLDGPCTLWERDGDRFIEHTGRYEKGRRVGRWVRRVEGTGVVRSAVVHDESGLASKEYFYCTNGNLKEVRGSLTLVYDASGNRLDEQSACPLP